MNLCRTWIGRKGGIQSSFGILALLSSRWLLYTFGTEPVGFTDDLTEEKTFRFAVLTNVTKIMASARAATFRPETLEGLAFVISIKRSLPFFEIVG